jgi:hypothetical protein
MIISIGSDIRFRLSSSLLTICGRRKYCITNVATGYDGACPQFDELGTRPVLSLEEGH